MSGCEGRTRLKITIWAFGKQDWAFFHYCDKVHGVVGAEVLAEDGGRCCSFRAPGYGALYRTYQMWETDLVVLRGGWETECDRPTRYAMLHLEVFI